MTCDATWIAMTNADFKAAVRRARELESDLESKVPDFAKSMRTARPSDQRKRTAQIEASLHDVSFSAMCLAPFVVTTARRAASQLYPGDGNRRPGGEDYGEFGDDATLPGSFG